MPCDHNGNTEAALSVIRTGSLSIILNVDVIRLTLGLPCNGYRTGYACNSSLRLE